MSDPGSTLFIEVGRVEETFITADSAAQFVLEHKTQIEDGLSSLDYEGRYLLQVGFAETFLSLGVYREEIFITLDNDLPSDKDDDAVFAVLGAIFPQFCGTIRTPSRTFSVPCAQSLETDTITLSQSPSPQISDSAPKSEHKDDSQEIEDLTSPTGSLQADSTGNGKQMPIAPQSDGPAAAVPSSVGDSPGNASTTAGIHFNVSSKLVGKPEFTNLSPSPQISDSAPKSEHKDDSQETEDLTSPTRSLQADSTGSGKQMPIAPQSDEPAAAVPSSVGDSPGNASTTAGIHFNISSKLVGKPEFTNLISDSAPKSEHEDDSQETEDLTSPTRSLQTNSTGSGRQRPIAPQSDGPAAAVPSSVGDSPGNASTTAGIHFNVSSKLVGKPEFTNLTRLRAILNPVTSASYNSYTAAQRSECFPGTRGQVLNDIEAWITGDTKQAPLYVLDGVAGIGKSTIAQTIAIRAASLGLLGGSFFFSSDEDLRNVARHFFPTIAYQLACYDSEFATRISHFLEEDPYAPERLLHRQLKILIQEPLQELLSRRAKPTLIVIDALNECEERNARELLLLFGQQVHQLKGLKVLITMRPEAHLRNLLDQNHTHERFYLHSIEDSIVHSDIRLYLQSRLSMEEVRKVSRNRRKPWQPSWKDMEMLSGICGTSFVIASTAVKFILDSSFDPQRQLSRLLDGVSPSKFTGSKYAQGLDYTYIRIIDAALTGDDEIDKQWLEDLNRVLGALITLANPLPYQALATLIGMDPYDLEETLSEMHSLVAPIGRGEDDTFRIHHKTFPDFITDKERIKRVLQIHKSTASPDIKSLLWIDVFDHHLRLSKACFRIMDQKLQWNIAKISPEDWYKDKKDIPHVVPRLISHDLAYAALHWASHLRSASKLGIDPDLQQYLSGWTMRHMLTWMEVMVVLDQVDRINDVLEDAIESVNPVTSWTDQAMVQKLLSDAYTLVQRGSEVMKLSPLHTYRSCLPYTPIETVLYKFYGTEAMLEIKVGRDHLSNPLRATLVGHSGPVWSVAFSYEGTHVASASADRTVRLWDAKTSAQISPPFGHSDAVNSVAFSIDGSRIVSGSDDHTVRLWDRKTGAHICTLSGHLDSVTSVTFSMDGSQIASGSGDHAVRLWDRNTGAHICTLSGHLDLVSSVVFSLDGYRLASASHDRTIRLWDAKTGAHINTLSGHLDSVNSVAFSSDGSQIASGSEDHTVRLWDGNTCTQICTLNGHSDSVTSVVFSPDGFQLASASHDYTIRLWDAKTGAHIYSFTEHSRAVNSIAFSGDGSRIVSGSDDTTIRLWDARLDVNASTPTGHLGLVKSVALANDVSILASTSYDNSIRLWDGNTGANIFTLTGHLDSVTSVALSSDGSRIASGSDDQTVCLWDGTTGVHISTLGGHCDSVISVAFSMDGSRIASGSNDHTVRLWDGITGVHISTLDGHRESVTSVAFSVDGSQIASGSDDHTVRLWEGNTGAHICTLDGHSDSVTSVVFSPDGSRLASASHDHTIRLWDPNTGASICSLTDQSHVVSLIAFADIGSRIAPVYDSPIVQLLDTSPDTGVPTTQFRLHQSTDRVGLLLHVKREEPPITGLIVTNGLSEAEGAFKWEDIPVCWFRPDLEVASLAVNQSNSQMAVGCRNGRVMLLDFSSSFSPP